MQFFAKKKKSNSNIKILKYVIILIFLNMNCSDTCKASLIGKNTLKI